MARPTYSTKLDTILAGDDHQVEWRLLTVALTWPDDGDPANDPPFAAGDYVSAPALTTPDVYAAATFNAGNWTDISALAIGYPQYRQSAGQACDVLSFEVRDTWGGVALKAVFAENRVLRLQERWRGAGQDTDWFDVAYCFSDGFNEGYDAQGRHCYQVTARDAMKFSGLHLMGRKTGFEVYQADLVREGSTATHLALTLVNTADDAYEYGVVDAGGKPHPNWAPTPSAQLWCHNPTTPVKLGVAGDAIQVVYGDGIVRIMKAYAAASPGASGEEDYSLGLGVVGAPDIRGVVYRYAHPACEGYTGSVVTDLADSLTVALSGPGWIVCAADLTALPDRLTLIALDGTGERVPTTGVTAAGGGSSQIALADATREIPVDTTWRYGDSNRLTEVARRMMLGAGYQTEDSGSPLYLAAISDPTVSGAARATTLPPRRYQDTDNETPMDALEDLRREGWVPPNWLARANASGQIRIESVEQLAAAHADIIPVTLLFAPATIQRLDVSAYTDVIARGLVRQVTDAGRAATVTVVAEVDGGLTSSPALTLAHSNAPTADQLAHLVRGGESYGVDSSKRRLFGWHRTATGFVRTAEIEKLAAQWMGAALLEVTLAGATDVDAVELDLSNPWANVFLTGTPAISNEPWPPYTEQYTIYKTGLTAQRLPSWEPGSWSVYYWDASYGWLPLISHVAGKYAFPDVQRIESAEFDVGAPVNTTKLRIYCNEPAAIENGIRFHSTSYTVLIGLWLSSIRVWGSSEIRGIASLGQTAPFNTAGWKAVRQRLRERTHVVGEAAPWAQTQTDADALAVAWLKEFTRDMAPRSLVVRRPEARLWDTVSATLPDGVAKEYLVTGTQRSEPGKVTLTVVDYSDPYG